MTRMECGDPDSPRPAQETGRVRKTASDDRKPGFEVGDLRWDSVSRKMPVCGGKSMCPEVGQWVEVDRSHRL